MIPEGAVQKALHIAWLAGVNGQKAPRLTWIPPRTGTDDPDGAWLVEHREVDGGADG